MSNQIVPRARYAATDLAKQDTHDVVEFGQHSSKIREVAQIANEEMGRVSAHTIGTMAELHFGATHVRRQLSDGGYRSDVYDEGQTVILQVTQQNLSILTNAAHKEIIEEAISRMR